MSKDDELVGTIVRYYRAEAAQNHVPPDPGPDPQGQPLAAIIVHVISDVHAKPKKGEEPAAESRVNLAIFNAGGGQYARENVLLWTSAAPGNAGWAELPTDTDARKASQDEAKKAAQQAQEAREKAAKDKAEKEARGQDPVDLQRLRALEDENRRLRSETRV